MIDLTVLVVFWSSIPASLILSVIGVLKNQYWLVLIGAVLFFPISYYFNGSPTSHGYGLLLPVFQVISAAAVKEENRLWAWLLLTPAFFIVIWFVLVVLSAQLG